jgi:hypothetical protein
MNKMLKREVSDYASKNKYTASFFEDDSIDIVRQQIAKSADSHPDRLFILVALKLQQDYYTSDPRRWEALFDRLSFNGQPLEKNSFQEYQLKYRTPNTSVSHHAYDKAEWMSMPESLRPLYEPTSDFIEYRILGVDELKSFVLPLDIDSQMASRIPSARLPIPETSKLFSTLYDHEKVERFLIRPYDESADTAVNVYYPLFRSTTPDRMTEESIRLLGKNANLLSGLLKLNTPQPESVTIVRTRFYIPWVGTDFGSAIRTRFEQLFYGLTLTKESPYIGLFTSKDQVTRHKFYVEDPNDKKPSVDMTTWNTWWSLTKPARNIPTLILYKGESKHHFDRIAISAKDMVLSTHRPEKNTETLKDLEKELSSWMKSLDSILPFLDDTDLKPDRWELQDMSFLAKYSNKLDDFDLLRFNCISSVFDISDKTKSQFSLLRTDHEHDGISSVEVKLLQMMKEGVILRAQDVAEELSVPVGEAGILIRKIEDRLEEDPKLGDRAFRGYPTIRLGPDSVIVSSVNNLEHPLKYASILRYILSNPDSSDVDALCPKRMEKVSVDTSVIPSENLEVDAALIDEYSDLFEYLEQGSDVKDETSTIAESTGSVQRISTEQTSKTIYSYFKNRLQQFDPETFDFPGSQYPKKCEQKHQPIALSEPDLKRIQGTEHDPRTYMSENQILDLENPNGKLICPEYWCMKDQIPLQESQLDHSTEFTRCPVCKGKLQTEGTDDPREFPLVKRETGFIYPGFVDYKSSNNGKNLPCCFRKAQLKRNEKIEKEIEDKYYILSETKTGIQQNRNAFLPETLTKSLVISESYELMKGKTRRLANGTSGFFRVGMGRPSETLPSFLGIKTKIPSPRESIETILKCSFLRRWTRPSDKHAQQIGTSLKSILPFEKDDLVRENLARLIAGVDVAYNKKELTILEELEYCSLALSCDIFRIFTETNTLGCMFYAPMVRPRTRGIVILQKGQDVDILSHVTRLSRGFEYKSNIFEDPFKRETYVALEKLRNQACITDIPTYETALKVIPQIAEDDYSIVLDPFGRGQAFYIPGKMILPFQSTPLPSVVHPKLSGYNEVDNLPTHETVLNQLSVAKKTSNGYDWAEDLQNMSGQITEVLTKSGLRIPVKPTESKQTESLEVFESMKDVGESNLALGPESEDLKLRHSKISYESEVYEFLIFQLTKDLETSEYKELRIALQEVNPKQKDVEQMLKIWFTETTQFLKIDTPIEFLSKVRTPCGQIKSECGGNMCAWDGDVCRIKIRDSVPKDKLFHRLLSTLLENSKIRSIVLDGRTTPFFSTILYLELPNELIVTDNELSNIVNV